MNLDCRLMVSSDLDSVFTSNPDPGCKFGLDPDSCCSLDWRSLVSFNLALGSRSDPVSGFGSRSLVSSDLDSGASSLDDSGLDPGFRSALESGFGSNLDPGCMSDLGPD